MAKPTIDDTRFGETTLGVESTQVTDLAAIPASGLRDTGYPDNTVPTAKVWTRLFNRSHKWFKYLDNLIDSTDNLYHGVRHKQFSGTCGVGGTSAYGYPTSTVNGAAVDMITSTGATSFLFPLRMHTGDRLVTGGSFQAVGAGVFDITAWSLEIISAAQALVATLASGSLTTVGAITNVAITIASPQVLVSSDRCVLRMSVNGANISIGDIDIAYDRPHP